MDYSCVYGYSPPHGDELLMIFVQTLSLLILRDAILISIGSGTDIFIAKHINICFILNKYFIKAKNAL